MKLSTITSKHSLNLVLIFCLTLLISIACEKKDVPATESSPPSKQVDEKNSTKKDNTSIGEAKSSRVIVEVNGTKLTQSEVDTMINRSLGSVKDKIPQDQMEKAKENIRKQFVDNFITRTLLTQEADKQNIVVSDDEVKQAMSEVEAKVPQGMTLEAALKQSGMSMEEMRENIVFSLRVNKLFESQIKTDIKPSDEEIKKYYNDNKKKFDTPEKAHARHILIKSDDKDNEKIKGEKKSKIDALRKQLLEGADFEKLAKENSDCPSGKKGGDLGEFSRGRMVKPFEDAAFSQKVNEIGQVIQTKFGYHIIQVIEHNEAKQQTLVEVKDTIKQTLENQKKQEITKNYITGIKEKAKIVYGTDDDSKK